MFDDYEVDYEGAADLKKDQHYHARTSFESLKRFAQTLAATPVDTAAKARVKRMLRDPYKRAPNKAQYWLGPNTKARRELDANREWLLVHSHELPYELENELGQMSHGRTYNEVPEAFVRDVGKDIAGQRAAQNDDGNRTFRVADQSDYDGDDTVSKYEAHGRMHVERNGCNAPLDQVLKDMGKEAENYPDLFRCAALRIRGERYKKHAEAQAKRLRWRGMEEYDAVEKANEKLREGVARKQSDSNAKPLPCIGRLAELFVVREGVLYRKRLDRPVTGKQVKVDGKVYYSDRIAYALTTGEDPADRMVRDGVATKYRKAEGTVTPRGDGKYDAQVAFGGDDRVTVGEYKSETQAQEACRLYLRSLEMGLM